MLRRRSLTFTIALLSSVTLMCGNGFDQAELECEEAISRMIECCPGFDKTLVRCYVEGCDDDTPITINLSDSQCILNHSCDAIRSADMCGRTQRVASSKANVSYDSDSGSVVPSAGVCP